MAPRAGRAEALKASRQEALRRSNERREKHEARSARKLRFAEALEASRQEALRRSNERRAKDEARGSGGFDRGGAQGDRVTTAGGRSPS